MQRSLGFGVVVLVGSISSGVHANGGEIVVGEPRPMGDGFFQAFAQLTCDGVPQRLGVLFDPNVLNGLPEHPNPTSRCFDLDDDGAFEDGECHGDYEVTLPMPQEVLQHADIPFRWIGVNWNPHGHMPPAPPVWHVPHFDFHFYIQPREEVQAIRPGPCGELIDCEDFVRATTPVASRFLPAHHIDVGAAVPGMGNHLINELAPELVDPSVPFTHTWIYGAYAGAITFYEPMITREFLASDPDVCTLLNLPEAWAQTGWYPTRYCIQHQGERRAVLLDQFVFRTLP